jgi:hypothetical protein
MIKLNQIDKLKIKLFPFFLKKFFFYKNLLKVSKRK